MSLSLRLLNFIFFSFFFFVSNAQTNYGDYLSSGNIFSDNFTGNNNKWVTGLSANGCYSSKIENGFFEITSTCKDTYPDYWIPYVVDATRDFEIETEILFVRGEDNNAISLIWGKDDNYNSFYFGISGNGQFKIYQYNGKWIILKDWTASDLVLKSDYNKLTVRRIGPEYYFFINEKLVLTSDFYSFFGNQIGFHDNQNTTLRVKYLKVSYLVPNSNNNRSAAPVPAAFSKTFVQPYIGISTDYILLTGSFDGSSFFQTSDETILVPKLHPSIGFGVLFGVKIGNGAIDFAYHISKMHYTSMVDGFSGTSTHHFIRYLSFKKYLNSFAEKKVKPYLDIDLSASISHFDKISYKLNDQAEYTSANYGGIIFGAGIGSLICLSKNLAFDFKVLPEFYIGTDIKPKGGTDYTIKKFNNFLLINSFGINYYFNKK